MSCQLEIPHCLLEQERMNLTAEISPAFQFEFQQRCRAPSEEPVPSRGLPERLLSHCPDCATASVLSPCELAARMATHKTFLLLDCRPFIAFNLNHINGSLNVNCADRFSKKRLCSGKSRVCDLVCGEEGKALFKELLSSDIVLYDEGSRGLNQLSTTDPMHVVLSALHREGRPAFVLQGGLTEFRSRYTNLCSKPYDITNNESLYSPTTPIVEPSIESATVSQVLPFLFLGNGRDAADSERLRELGITHVLNVTSHIPNHFEANGVCYKRLPATDTAHQNLSQYFQDAFQFIDDSVHSGGKVLVHCQGGVSRSATITVAYIMRNSYLSMVDSYKFVKSKRTIIAPNFNFMGQLLEFEQGLNDGHITRDHRLNLKLDNHV